MRPEKQATVLATKDLEITLSRDGFNRERIGIERQYPTEYPNSEFSGNMFRWFALMYIVSPYLPEKVTTDFLVPEPVQNLIGQMYIHEDHDPPKFCLTKTGLTNRFSKVPRVDLPTEKAVLTYSGGKDTLQNLSWMEKEYGLENVLAVHFKGMNKVNSGDEYRMSAEQSKHIGFLLETINLLNGSKNHGHEIMRARDMFIVGLTAPTAMRFSASKIILEGGYYGKDEGQGEPFTTHLYAWNLFNETLKELGLPVQASWKDCDGVKAVEELSKHHPDWLALVANCFLPPHRRKSSREKWLKNTPGLKPLGENCGSCVKCREVALGRIGVDPTLKTNDREIAFFVADTVRYFHAHPEKRDFLVGSFEKKLRSLAQKHGIVF